MEAIRVYDKNIPQFFQVNTLEGSKELRRVGRVIWKDVVQLNYDQEMKNQWIRYGLDMTLLIKENPGGLFQIRLTFRPSHIAYSCVQVPESETEAEYGEYEEGEEEMESSNWDSYEEEGGGYNNDFYQRYNPCHPAFYKKYDDHTIKVARNILISDIGLIAKRGNDGSIVVCVNDIKNVQPLSGVMLTLMDFQQEVIVRGKTDKKGMEVFYPERRPFLVIAENNKQTGFLKLDDGSALSVSHFDVSGRTIEKGLKGFIYGERGVWRPGDPIYLTFILMDTATLPENYPVICELRNPKGQLIKTMKNKEPLNGFYSFTIETSPDAPTGNWTARIKAGGALFEKVLKIETVMPNRLKIKLDFGCEMESLSRGEVNGTVSSMWLHGAVAKNLKTDDFDPHRKTLALLGICFLMALPLLI